MASSSSSVIEVENALVMDEDDIADVRRALIFRVPKPLRDSNDRLYSPHLVSIGPFHYGREELIAMEHSKSLAVRRMQERIQWNNSGASIQSIVEKDILHKDKEIREFYGEHIPYTPIELASMVTRDACFIFEFFVNYVIVDDEIGQNIYMEELTSFSSKNDPVFDVTYQNPTRARIMEDILLFENQIPLFVLQHLLQIQNGSSDVSNKKLGVLMGLVQRLAFRHSAFPWCIIYSMEDLSALEKCCHILEVFYHGLVGLDVESYERTKAQELRTSSCDRMQIWFKNGVDSMKATCGCDRMQIWLKNGVNSTKAICGRLCNTSRGELTHQGVKIRPGAVKLKLLKLPSAIELTRQGVKICPVLEQHVKENQKTLPTISAIKWIRFDEKTSTLYLPQVRVTPQSESVMRSIIAMEVSKWKYHPRPMTQLALFMDELIDTEEDVAVFRKAEVISNFLGSNRGVAQLINSQIRGITPAEGCKVIDDARRNLYRYTRKKYKILWSEFLSAYFSKPWLVAGSMAAVLLLLMTVAQVFCLFFTCNP